MEYVIRAEELNRGLTLAREVAADDQHTSGVIAQYNRNRAKAEAVLEKQHKRLGGRSPFKAAEAAVYGLSKKTPPGPERTVRDS